MQEITDTIISQDYLDYDFKCPACNYIGMLAERERITSCPNCGGSLI